MILDFIRLTDDSIHSGEWTFAEIEDRMLLARLGTQEYLVSQRSLIEELHILQYEVRKMNDIHRHKIVGIGGVTEAVYFKIYELVSLQKQSRVALDISETQKELEAILIEAVDMGASDLHITRNDILAQLEVRVNGMLLPMMQMPASKCDELVFVLYNVQASTRDTTWNRTIPQSANILYTLNGLSFRFRYAHFPIFGETNDCFHAVLRIIPSGLSKGAVANLNKLGISEEELEDLKKILSNPYGAYFIAGTTGSGKSTTLKNLMEWLQVNRYGNKGCFLTVEDPVEYQIFGAKQSSVVSVEGGGFHSAIKSALRRDPDVLMVGEIRDSISANALAGAVESGHYCFTTVHAGNIVSLLQRLSAMGITSDKLSTPGFIAGLQCQKLVPVICPRCHHSVEITFGEKLMTLYEQNERGCEKCKHTGISGRQLVMEYMRPTYDELAAISKQEWLQVYTLWRKKRISSPGLSEGFEIKEKVFAEVLRGRVCATWFSMEFGDVDKDNSEIIHGKVR
ncbi:ATPase, T2SS/T4P/T4SS family [Rahnella sp. WP5]|uniref:ATPase, T2SS/T4P/T4SS family n=1 Tax=Rahnella sp. WP5 TaxID=1500266 RepID=UPI000561AFE3|nr:ATPase, T2SS/T4P/T4SS family [Rahnella sp. WP5]